MTVQPEDLTDKLLKRAEASLALLQAHLEDTGARHYTGRAMAAQAIVTQMGKDYRYHKATLKQALRRRRAVRKPKSATVHERM